jgi:hypothetical protein
VPADAVPGEYITSLVLENEDPFLQPGPLTVNQVVRQAVAVVVTVPGQRSPGLAIGSASHKVVAGISVVAVAVDNTGNIRLKPVVTFALLDVDGTLVSQTTVPMDTFYARTSTLVEVPLGVRLPGGHYTIRFSVEDSAEGVGARENAISLSVEAVSDGPDGGAVAPGGPLIFDGGGMTPGGWIAIVLVGLLLAAGCVGIVHARRRHGGAQA